MSIALYSGYNYPPVFVFPDRINIPREFNIITYDDSELLKFNQDRFGRQAIIKLSKVPYVRYEYFNWEYKGQDTTYKWYYLSPSGNVVYRRYPQGGIVPIISGDGVDFWESKNISGYLMHDSLGSNFSGHFEEDVFVRVDIEKNPTGWIKEDDPFPLYDNEPKPTFDEIEKNQYIPIKFTVGTEKDTDVGYIEANDMTRYKENVIPILDTNAVNNPGALQFYFDGRNLVTNFNFEDENFRKSVHIVYEYTIDKLKLAAKLYTNKKGQSEYTPILSNYILKISTQRVNK